MPGKTPEELERMITDEATRASTMEQQLTTAIITEANTRTTVMHGDPVSFKSIKTTGAIEVGTNLTAHGNTDIKANLTVNGDITQHGEHYIVHAVDLKVKDNTILLRDEATTGLSDLPNEKYSGLVIYKYNGTDNLNLVVDKNGEARLGKDDGLEPLLTREEEDQMQKNSPLIWDNTNRRAITIQVPDNSIGKVLVYNGTDAAPSFEKYSTTVSSTPTEGDLNPITSDAVAKLISTLALKTHPKGTLYWTEDDAFDPNTEWGGTWVRIQDKMIMAKGTTFNVDGGNPTGKIKLNANQLPAHKHDIKVKTKSSGEHKHFNGLGFFNKENLNQYNFYGGSMSSGDTRGLLKGLGGNGFYQPYTSTATSHTHDIDSITENNSTTKQDIDIMPPYEIANCWKRTA